MTLAERIRDLEERIADRKGESSACSDRTCSCKSASFDLEEELDLLLDAQEHDEAAWKDLRDEGVDELTLRYLAGDR